MFKRGQRVQITSGKEFNKRGQPLVGRTGTVKEVWINNGPDEYKISLGKRLYVWLSGKSLRGD